MKVLVHLHTTLQKVTSDGLIRQLEVELEPGATLDDLIAFLNLGVDEAHTLLVIQGQIAEGGQVLSDGDEVHFMPAISGGGIPSITNHQEYTL